MNRLLFLIFILLHLVVRPGHHPGTDFVYKMTALPRGIALIINNAFFREDKTRCGSGEDVPGLTKLFGDLGFTVIPKENRTREQILHDVESIASEKVLPEHDCFVLWLMSHGSSGEVFGSDEIPLTIQTIKGGLSNESCAALTGKPKLLFVQACRGEELDKAVRIPSDHVDQSTVHQTESTSVSYKLISRHSDFLTCYATVDGHLSMRSHSKGSLFVRAFVKIFEQHSANDTLDSLLNKIRKEVSEMVVTIEDQKYIQIPQAETTLLKDLKF